MSYRAFLDELKKGLPASAYVLTAADTFLHGEAAGRIREQVPAAERDFSFHSFDLAVAAAEKTPFDQILDILNTAPFFGGKKYVIIENVQKVLKKELQSLERYLAAPSETSTVMLLFSGTAKDMKKELREALQKVKQIPLDVREKDIPSWLKDVARSRGYELASSAAEYLVGTIGTDLGMLSSEIDKLMLIGKSPVVKEDVIELIEGKRSYNAFDLVNALLQRNAEEAFRIYRVLRESEEPANLLGALNWQYSRNLAAGNSPAERSRSEGIFRLLNSADVNVKSSGGVYPLELLLVRLLRTSGRR